MSFGKKKSIFVNPYPLGFYDRVVFFWQEIEIVLRNEQFQFPKSNFTSNDF